MWGIALNGKVTGVESYLHDGRARSLIESVLWHGGEAQRSRAPIERLVNVVAGYFVPAVLAISVLTFVVWGVWGPEPGWPTPR